MAEQELPFALLVYIGRQTRGVAGNVTPYMSPADGWLKGMHETVAHLREIGAINLDAVIAHNNREAPNAE